MQSMHNSVMLTGNLGADIEITRLGNGKQVARVMIATDAYIRRASGGLEKQTQWHNLIAWGPTAEHMQRCLAKGSFVIIHGKLVNREYLGRDGNMHYHTEIVVKEFSYLRPHTSPPKRSAA